MGPGLLLLRKGNGHQPRVPRQQQHKNPTAFKHCQGGHIFSIVCFIFKPGYFFLSPSKNVIYINRNVNTQEKKAPEEVPRSAAAAIVPRQAPPRGQ